MGAVRGKDFTLYLGGEDPYDYDNPTWVLVSNVRDVTRNLEKALADASIRGSTFRLQLATLADLSLDVEMVYDPTDTNLQTFEDAFFNNEPVILLCLDGPITTVGSSGITFTAQISKFGQDEALEDVGKVPITFVPTYDPVHLPRRVHVATPGAVVNT